MGNVLTRFREYVRDRRRRRKGRSHSDGDIRRDTPPNTGEQSRSHSMDGRINLNSVDHTPTGTMGGSAGRRNGLGTRMESLNGNTPTHSPVLGQSARTTKNSQDPAPEPPIDEYSLIALHSYDARADGDLGFRKGDLMKLMDDSNPDWWYVKQKGRDESGYVPRNFIGWKQAAESEEWFAGKTPRFRAERLVMLRNLPKGAFLVRERETGEGGYALTIRDYELSKGDVVKHYKIKTLDAGGYFITSRNTFQTLKDLVSFYSNSSEGLCCKLTFPAPRLAPTRPDLSHKTSENWEIPRNQLELQERVGSGNFGEVWKGLWLGGVEVAVKTLKPSTMSPEGFLTEAGIMKKCSHPNLVRLYGVCSQEEPLYIVSEFMSNGCLLSFLRGQPEHPPLPLSHIASMASQIAYGMSYLEGHQVIHRDLAARNVLVGDKIAGIPIVKVADFGLARVLMEENVYEARTGAKFPMKWTAPEAALTGAFTVKSDVWSFGILLFEIVTKGKGPYAGMTNAEVIQHVENGYRIPQPETCPEPVYEVMLGTWNRAPEERPTFDYLYHFFDDYFASSQPNYAQQPNDFD